MAHPMSIAAGGYFPFPVDLIPHVAGLLRPFSSQAYYDSFAIVDPCMGTGEALCLLAQRLFTKKQVDERLRIFGVEMEATRYRQARRWRGLVREGQFQVAHGDAFRLFADRTPCLGSRPYEGAGLVFLNPPYENGVMEAKFLAWSLPLFGQGGALVYVIPGYALGKSAACLAQHFDRIHVYRLPDPHYAAFRQVVLLATRRVGLLHPDPALEAKIRAWGDHPDALPVLPAPGTAKMQTELPAYATAGFSAWDVRPTDAVKLLTKLRPWHMTTRSGEGKPIPGIMPARAEEDLMCKVYPLASIPRPAYVSAALAADIYSGKRITPKDPASGLPDLLIKGVFDKADREIETRVDKEGTPKGKVLIEQPRLAVTVLDLARHTYHTIANAVEVTGSTDIATMTMGDLLEHYGPALLEAMFEACPVLHDARREDHRFPLPTFARPLYKAQEHAVMTCVKLLGGAGLSLASRRGQGAFLYGQLGVGKSSVSLAVARTIGSRRPLVLCPPNILQSWRDQVSAVMPEARLRMIDGLDAVDQAAAGAGVAGEEVAILSREAAKLGSAWQGIGTTAIVPPAAWASGRETGAAWLNEPHRESFTLRLMVDRVGKADLQDGDDSDADRGPAELFLAVETSDDGKAWRLLGTFPAVRAAGEHDLHVHSAGRWLRASWESTGDLSFAVEPAFPIRRPLCPRCGAEVTEHPDRLAAQHATCQAKRRMPAWIRTGEDDETVETGAGYRCPIARTVEAMALALLPIAPEDARVVQHLQGRHLARMTARAIARDQARHTALTKKHGGDPYEATATMDVERQALWTKRRASVPLLKMAFRALCQARAQHEIAYSRPHDHVKGEWEAKEGFSLGIVLLAASLADPTWVAQEAVALYESTKDLDDKHNRQTAGIIRGLARDLLFLLPLGGDEQRRAEAAMRALELEQEYQSYGPSWSAWKKERDDMLRDWPGVGTVRAKGGKLSIEDRPLGHYEQALKALELLTVVGRWEETPPCGERLYQAVPIPRRYPIAKYITKRHRGLFDFLMIDEAHQYASPTSAQSFAARRLIWTGTPCLLLTGTAMGGLAEQLFTMQWAIDPLFRAEFAHDEIRRFVEIFGFLKKIEEDRDASTKAVVAYGSMSDRVVRSTRTLGSAPGVLPLYLLAFMLRKACILHRSDFDFELPGVEEIPVAVTADGEHQKRYEELREALKARIRADKRDPERRGKLMGQLTRLPSYLDMATDDCGNGEGGAFEVTYPPPPKAKRPSRARGLPRAPVERGALVHRVEPFPRATRTAKERKLISIARRELAEGRPFTVFAWNTPVLARLARILHEDLGEPVAFLQAGKVSAADRQRWIDREVIAKKVRVLVVNAVCVGVGLNNLVYFPTAIWFENPLCDAVVRRQADGRFDRLGKTLVTRIYTLYYEDTVQAQLYTLLMHKVGVSQATDGLDASAALTAAGVGEQDRFSDLAIANVIYAMIEGSYHAPKTGKAALTLGAVPAL